jgi:hypothetical protein
MIRRAVSVSLRTHDILKLTFLFLATFSRAHLLPARAEKTLRARNKSRKSARGADLTSIVKCSTQSAQCNASRVPCTLHPASRLMHGVFRALQRVFVLAVPCRLQPTSCFAHSELLWLPDVRFCLSTLMAQASWSTQKVLGWRISNTLETDFCVEALNEAIHRFDAPGIMNTYRG